MQTNQDLQLTFPAGRNQRLILVTAEGKERMIGSSDGTSVTAGLPLEWTSEGRATLRLDN